MRAWLPERQVYGPEVARERDTEDLNRVFADAFTDRYRRDGLVGVRVPHLNPQVARYWLLEQGVGTLGLETMPRTVENIGFYARLGFSPGHLTVTLTNDIATRGHSAPVLLSQRKGAAVEDGLAAARRLVSSLAPGYDFTREIRLTLELGLGDTSLVDGDDGLRALVLWHSAALAEGRPRDRSEERRVGKE